MSSCSNSKNFYAEKETPFPDLETYNYLLNSYVSDSGRVNYKLLMVDQTVLNRSAEDLSAEKPGINWTENEKKAFWINLYNLYTLKLITEHYPLESIKDLNPFLTIPTIHTVWTKEKFKLGESEISLDEIEHEILRKEFSDPRIHFAINCASVSCPKLLNEAYMPQKLDTQLENQAVFFINNPEKNIISESELKLSLIFNWFEDDFENEGNLKDFLAKYSKVPVNKDLKIEYLEYNWNLNE